MKETISYKEFLNEFEILRKKYTNYKLPCFLYPKCNKSSINSHMFQKNNILSSITTNGKLYTFNYTHLQDTNKLRYELKGLNTILSFNGFCNQHDDKIFAPIEKSYDDELIDWNEQRSQFLLSYRALALETHRHNVLLEISIDMHQNSERFFYVDFYSIINQLQFRQRSLLIPNKKKLEKGVFDSDYSSFKFETISLPFKLELCLSAVFAINHLSCINYNTDLQEPNIVNIFPYKTNTIIVLGYSDDFENLWYNKTSKMLKSNDALIISIALQDILFRTEFHCISSSLHNEIENNIPKFIEEYLEKLSNYELNLNIQSNILYEPIKRLMNTLK